MVYLIAGLDRTTHSRWHDHVMAADVTIATRIAQARAASQGVELVVAAVIGPYSSVVSDPGRPSHVDGCTPALPTTRRGVGARPHAKREGRDSNPNCQFRPSAQAAA